MVIQRAMLCSRSPLVRFTPIALALFMGGFSGGCSSQREAILSKLELDRLFHRVDVAADRADQERVARERMASSYWGMQSSTLEREIARPDPNTATSSSDLIASRPGATPIEMSPVATAAVSSPSQRAPQAEVQMPSPPPPPKLVELPLPPRPATTGAGRVEAVPGAVATVAATPQNGFHVQESGAPAGAARSEAGAMQPSFYGVASDPAELLEGGNEPLYSGNEIIAASGGQEDISLYRPAYGSMTLNEGEGKSASAPDSNRSEAATPNPSAGSTASSTPQPETALPAGVATTVPGNAAAGAPETVETEDWANLISSIRPFSNHAPAPETPVSE